VAKIHYHVIVHYGLTAGWEFLLQLIVYANSSNLSAEQLHETTLHIPYSAAPDHPWLGSKQARWGTTGQIDHACSSYGCKQPSTKSQPYPQGH
jgi:hypothetical protein